VIGFVIDHQLGNLVVLIWETASINSSNMFGGVIQLAGISSTVYFRPTSSGVVVKNGHLVHHVDHAFKLVFLANRNDHRIRVGAEFLRISLRRFRSGPNAVHLVNDAMRGTRILWPGARLFQIAAEPPRREYPMACTRNIVHRGAHIDAGKNHDH